MISLKKALINEVRRLMTDPAERGTEQVDTLTGNGTNKVFTLTKASLMFVTSVVVTGTAKKLITEYEIDFGTSTTYGKIILETAAPDAANNVVITYDYGTNWVYDDQPLVSASMPRVSILNIGGADETSAGMSDGIIFMHPTFRVGVWVRTGKAYTIGGYSYTGSKLLDYMVTDLQNAIHSIRSNQRIGNLIDIKIAPAVYLGLDEAHKLKRSESKVTTYFQKSYS